MVGAALALGLAERHQVVLFDHATPSASEAQWDLRISSVSQGNLNWLARWQIEDLVDKHKCRDYQQLEIIDQRGQRLVCDAEDVAEARLGAMIENRALRHALWQRLPQNVTQVVGDPLQVWQPQQQLLTCQSGQQFPVDLLIGCDGARSWVAQQQDFAVVAEDYDQDCILALAKLPQAVSAKTWQQFRDEGPIALLPLTQNQVCLILYQRRQTVVRWGAEDSMADRVSDAFQPYLGQLSISQLASFPLRRQHARRYHVGAHTALAGDAAHTIHPMAGLGVNLGFHDARQLVASLNNGISEAALANYQRQCQRYNRKALALLDGLHRLNTGNGAERLLRPLQSAALTLLGQVPQMRKWFIRQALN